MSSGHSFLLSVVLQVTVITAVAAAARGFACAGRRQGTPWACLCWAFRLASPVGVLLLPRAAWWQHAEPGVRHEPAPRAVVVGVR